MKTRFITALFAAASLLAGCSKETTGPGDTDDSRIPITFTLATPGSEGVIYPRSATRATHDAAEYAVRQLTLLVYDATDTSAPKFLRKHDMTSDITLYDNGNGTYTFSLEAPISDMNAKRKFVFVVNDDAAVAATAAGSAEADLHETAATVELADGDTADKLAEADAGIAMSGTATADGQNEVITIVPGVKCEVKLTRIVARVDVQNNTPNMTLESAVLVGAATRGYLFAQAPLSAPVADRIVLGSNATVDLTEEHPALKPGEVFAPKTFRKTFYAYERPNTAGDYAAVRITYRVNDSKGTVEVPFIRTEAGGAQTPVDIERNHLYTVVLGNGKPVTTNEVQFTFKVEDWNTVEMPEEIGPGDPLDPESQQKLNAALKVNMFTPFNAKSVDLGTKKINSFYDKLTVSADDCPTDSYFTYTELKDAGLTAADAVLTDGEGNEYRLPTEGELNLLLPMWTEEADRATVNKEKDGVYHPYWNDNASTNTFPYVTVTTPFTETIYLKNGADNYPDKTHPADPEYTLKGQSQLKVGVQTEQIAYPINPGTDIYNLHPVYGLRFKGTSQYAAYRWETCKIAGNPLERYFSIKIKAMHPQDNATTIDDVADEAFWKEGFIEFQFPASGYYVPENADDPTPENITDRGVHGYCWASSLWTEASHARGLGFYLDNALVGRHNPGSRFPLRFVKVSE
ncbi:hypothetical protein [Alistipes senegalensis]|uniref:hypothetical protein n=2 Tax=Alistipes senegalensis TaxID=1288121 RepID=UPI00242A5E5F|nr:hypothetical protein [Alistipes senegalensis]MCI7307286.1 hypothetical protein [Alistipes senegalensis]MDY2877144.1 hypothetical protein [Alistipes senegalensis]